MRLKNYDMKLNNSVSKMTLGTVQLGLNYGIANIEGKPEEEKAIRILDSAVASGVNCLDTAADYGDSEKVIGKYLTASRKKRSEIIIVTKFKLGKINKADVESDIMKSVTRSLRNLNSDYIDILLMHDAKEYSAFGKEITKVYENLLEEGLVKVAGASCYKYNDIAPMLSNDIFDAFQIPVNLLDTRITKGEAARKLKDKLIFARSVFLQGLFFIDPANLKGNLKEIGKYIITLKEIASDLNISIAHLAVTYVKSLKTVDSLVIGADNPAQVKENAKLIESVPFNHETIDEIEKRLAGAPEWLFMPFLWDDQKD
jgi:aryl-alcohol dehydrogenase-like predicted oxidoreductase